jgi:hypothetical protein
MNGVANRSVVAVVILEVEFFISARDPDSFWSVFFRKGNGKTNNYYLKMGE